MDCTIQYPNCSVNIIPFIGLKSKYFYILHIVTIAILSLDNLKLILDQIDIVPEKKSYWQEK
jgi:nucleosome binding factor SPN SPT16 subunit